MNILIATDVFPPKSGGSGWSTFYLARALVQRGHRVEIVQPKPGARAIETRVYEGLNVTEVGYAATTLPGVRAWQRNNALGKTLSAYLAACGPEFDLIHAQHVLSISAAAAAKRHARLSLVSTVRDYWAVCLYGTLWRDDGICPICRDGEITRCLAQTYGGAAKFMAPLVPLVERELRRRQRALRESDAVIAVSQFVAGTLHGIVDQTKLRVVPNLIDVIQVQEIADGGWRMSNDKPFLVFIGKLNSLKGADLLPEILQKSGVQLPLVVAGDGELKNALAQTPGVDVRGWLSNAETLGLLARARALLFPSRWAEPLARTLLEAQALGVPTVALNRGGTRDIIQGNFNGLLAETVDEFAVHTRRLADNPALGERLSANAKRVAVEKFSPDTVAAQLESVYEFATHDLQSAIRN